MSTLTLNRFEWLKAVNRADLLPRAKVVASALAVEFCNDETGRLDPSRKRLAEASGLTLDTVKRAVQDLIEGGWLARSEGRGRGNNTNYTLLSPGKIVAFASPKKDAPAHGAKGGTRAPLPNQKGAPVHGKGGTRAPSYNKDEQSFEQRSARATGFKDFQFSGRAIPGLILVPAKNHQDLNAWGEWLAREGFPPLHALGIKKTDEKTRSEFFSLPYRNPPTDEKQASEAREFFAALTKEGIAA